MATILTIILVFWVLKWVLALIGPWLLKLFAKRMLKKAGFDESAFSGSTSGQSFKQEEEDSRTETVKNGKWWKEDEVILKPSRKNGQRISDILGGEYIEYEEVSAS